MEEAVLGGTDFNIHKLMINNQDKTEWKKSSPLKTYSKKTTPTSDGKSRYGRSHKPRLSGDFLSTDKKVSHYLKIDVDNQMHYFKASPYAVQKTPNKNLSPGTPRRGRPPKALSLLKQENKVLSEYGIKASLAVSNIIDIEAPVPTSTETLPVPDQLVIPKEEQLSDSEEFIDGDWNVGDLAWACVGGFPYWPCAITKDPVEHCFKKIKISGKNRQPKECIHVRFFGDKGRRSWIYATHILPFHGLDSFLSLAEETCTPSIKKKDPRLYRSFTVLPSVRKAWQAAVSEAESLIESPRHERVAYFMNLYPVTPPSERELLQGVNAIKPEPKKRGRKRKIDLTVPPPIEEKKIKIEPEFDDEPPQPDVHHSPAVAPASITPTPATVPIASPAPQNFHVPDRAIKSEPISPVKESPFQSSATQDSTVPEKAVTTPKPQPSTPIEGQIKKEIKSETKSTTSTGKKRGRPPGRRKKSQEDQFDFTPLKRKYVKKSSNDQRQRENRIKKRTQNLDMRKLKKLRDPAYEMFYEKNFDRVSDENPELSEDDIDKFIEKMWKEVKAKQAGFKARSRDGGGSESGGESKSETSSRSDSPPPLILPSVKTVFKRGISLFSGAKNEKVCQICFKGGDVLKCRGPCGQPFHTDCAGKARYQPSTEKVDKIEEQVVKKKRGRPRKSLPPLPFVDTACPEDIKPVITNSEDIKPSSDNDTDAKESQDNSENISSVSDATEEDVKPAADKNPISTVESVANSCIAALKEQMEKDAPPYNFSNKENEASDKHEVSAPKTEKSDSESIENVTDYEKETTAAGTESPTETEQDSFELSLGMDSNDEENSEKLNDSDKKNKTADIAETNESIEAELLNSKFTKEDSTTSISPSDSCNDISLNNSKSLDVSSSDANDSIMKDSSSLEDSGSVKANEMENARKDNLKLLGTLRGDSFESESSNNNMLVVDDSSTDDRLMIEESPASDENSTQEPSAEAVANKDSIDQSDSASTKCDEPKGNEETPASLLIDMPIIDFSDMTDSDQNEPMMITDNEKDIPSNPVCPDQYTDDSSLSNRVKDEEVAIDTPPVSSPIGASNIKTEAEEKESSSGEDSSKKGPKAAKKQEKETVKRNSKVGRARKDTKDEVDSSAKSSDTDSDKTKNKGWLCDLCTEGKFGPCFICGKDEDERLRCGYCGKVYHLKCAKEWPQSQISETAKGRLIFHCPQHVCHTCISDNPSSVCARFTNDRLVRCVMCPSTYHYGNFCIPAGSEILSMSQIICPRHYVPNRKGIHHVNASWCFICAIGGTLICCDLCPNSFHAECLKINPPEGAFICEDCETGRYPLFGEIVWVKLGTYRWWPAKILYPQEVPENINQLSHTRGEFAVEFFGTHDYYWVNRGRVFLYHEGDGCKIVSKSRVDELFTRGVQEASEAFLKWSEERANREATSRPSMKPPKYVKIQSNRILGNVNRYQDLKDENVATTCDCDPSKPNPCGPESDCINRLLMVECDPQVCPAGENCCNQNFEKRNYPSLVPYKTENRGWGLKTLDPIPKGGFIIEYVGEMIDEEEYRKRLTTMQQNKDENFYFLTIDKDRMLDAGPKGNVARFMNHSCDPNCETQKWTVNGDTRVGLFALKDIKAGTELVFNYNLETIGNTKVECKCGATNCAGYIGAKGLSKTNNNKPKNGGVDEKKNSIKKRKKKSTKPNKHTEDTCFTCGNGGELLLCDDASCPKAYHLSCLGLTKHPAGGWVCPWHQCSVCSATKVQRCTLCINSYCSEHAEGNISLNRNHGLLCFSHNLSDSGSDWSAISEDEESSSRAKNGSRKFSRSKSIVNGHAD